MFSLEDDDCNELFITQTPKISSSSMDLDSINSENLGFQRDKSLSECKPYVFGYF